MLKKWVGKEEKEGQSNEELKNDLQSKTLSLEREIDEIRNTVNKIISFLQQGCCYTQDSSSSIDVSPPSTTFTNI